MQVCPELLLDDFVRKEDVLSVAPVFVSMQCSESLAGLSVNKCI